MTELTVPRKHEIAVVFEETAAAALYSTFQLRQPGDIIEISTFVHVACVLEESECCRAPI